MQRLNEQQLRPLGLAAPHYTLLTSVHATRGSPAPSWPAASA
ncbi:hypothetical protein OG381_03060 [Streptomyces sp. NBC_00490]